MIAVRDRLAWFPMPTFEYRQWLVGLTVAHLVSLALTPFAYRNARRLRPLAYFYAGVMLLNGMGHTVFTVLGRTVASVQFPRPAPGFYSSPFSADHFELSVHAPAPNPRVKLSRPLAGPSCYLEETEMKSLRPCMNLKTDRCRILFLAISCCCLSAARSMPKQDLETPRNQNRRFSRLKSPSSLLSETRLSMVRPGQLRGPGFWHSSPKTVPKTH